jgi:hypothetical protein
MTGVPGFFFFGESIRAVRFLPDSPDFHLLGHFVGAAHALIALAGMAIAVRAYADGLQLAVVLRVVMAAGSHGAMNGLVVHTFPSIQKIERIARPYGLQSGVDYALFFVGASPGASLEKRRATGYNKN